MKLRRSSVPTITEIPIKTKNATTDIRKAESNVAFFV